MQYDKMTQGYSESRWELQCGLINPLQVQNFCDFTKKILKRV